MGLGLCKTFECCWPKALGSLAPVVIGDRPVVTGGGPRSSSRGGSLLADSCRKQFRVIKRRRRCRKPSLITWLPTVLKLCKARPVTPACFCRTTRDHRDGATQSFVVQGFGTSLRFRTRPVHRSSTPSQEVASLTRTTLWSRLLWQQETASGKSAADRVILRGSLPRESLASGRGLFTKRTFKDFKDSKHVVVR